MSDLVEWLTKILDEDEKAVRLGLQKWDAQYAETWSVRRTGDLLNTYEVYRDMPSMTEVPHLQFDRVWGDAIAKHIARYDPAAVLADIAAKRAVLRLHAAVEGDRHCGVCMLTAPCRTLRLIASAYADRPGYDENWRP